ncbi:MAG: endonuclease domain-containing protein, partial [Bacteroidetes bacterium]
MAYLGKTRTPSYFYHADAETIEFAKRLREKMTPCEKTLWERLRRKNLRGVKFRRQHPIEYYIADFYCHEARLVIEVDGPIHEKEEQKLHDENRTAELDRFDIKGIRFPNEEIKNHIGSVM